MSESASPWDEPDEETRASARSIEARLEEKLSAIDTPDKARALLERLEADSRDQRAAEVADSVRPDQSASPKEAVEDASAMIDEAVGRETSGDPADEAAAAIEAIAAMAARMDGQAYEALVGAVQDVTDPALKGEPEKLNRPRYFLRDAIMHDPRLTVLQRYDTAIFLAINNRIHHPVLNHFFSRLSFLFNGGFAWIGAVLLLLPFRRHTASRLLRRMIGPICVAALVVEGPVKRYFRRRRPFIDVVRAIVVGKKPGNWSFPSGHSAAAFAGAHVLGKCLPPWRLYFHVIAGLVGFSRIYLGAHYPSDVVSGSLIGLILAEGTDLGLRRWHET